MIISGERRITHGEIQTRIRKATSGFRALGLPEGTPIATMLRNDFAFFEVAAASSDLGSSIVPLNWHLKAEEVQYILTDSGAKILVCHADLLPQIRAGVPDDVLVLVVETPPEIAAAFGIAPELTRVPAGLRDWDRWRDGHGESQEPPRHGAPMIYTSGTTGMPKGVRRTPMLPSQAEAVARVGRITYGIRPQEDQVVLINGPMYHSAPHSYGTLAFRSGCTIVIQSRFDAAEL
ncbi:MAG: AMP-binding protein, partial [Bradyrhizobium sp.]|nr:AMP-binding protein [Bradyrhizobium sp.]